MSPLVHPAPASGIQLASGPVLQTAVFVENNSTLTFELRLWENESYRLRGEREIRLAVSKSNVTIADNAPARDLAWVFDVGAGQM